MIYYGTKCLALNCKSAVTYYSTYLDGVHFAGDKLRIIGSMSMSIVADSSIKMKVLCVLLSFSKQEMLHGRLSVR